LHRAPPTHVAGADLVRTHFKHYFGKRFEKEIPIVAAYPENYQHEAAWRELGLNGPMPQQKQYHMEIVSCFVSPATRGRG
jgi:hypothetical protein